MQQADKSGVLKRILQAYEGESQTYAFQAKKNETARYRVYYIMHIIVMIKILSISRIINMSLLIF